MISPSRLGLLAVALILAIGGPVVAADSPEMPAFRDELAPFVGTWRHDYRYQGKGKDIPLWLVIKQEDGRLRLRFQLPLRKKRISSDWDGQIEIKLQTNIKEKRTTTYRVETAPPRIAFSEIKSYTGTWDGREVHEEGHYELTDDGGLQLVCRSRREQDEQLPCYAPFRWERVSAATDWPD